MLPFGAGAVMGWYPDHKVLVMFCFLTWMPVTKVYSICENSSTYILWYKHFTVCVYTHTHTHIFFHWKVFIKSTSTLFNCNYPLQQRPSLVSCRSPRWSGRTGSSGSHTPAASLPHCPLLGAAPTTLHTLPCLAVAVLTPELLPNQLPRSLSDYSPLFVP